MGYCRPGLAAAAVLCLLIVSAPAPASAGSAATLVIMRAGVAADIPERRPVIAAHFRKVQSFYCYPRNYWWFYRPYTTAEQGYARCMPYFHYLEGPSFGRGAKPDRAMK